MECRQIKSWAKMCLNKKKFITQKFAEKVARKFNQRVYYCPHCFHYHCTKQKEKE